MTPAALLAGLRAAGFTARADGGRLLVAPASRLTPDQRAALAGARAAVLEELEWERACGVLDGFLPDFAAGPVALAEAAVVDCGGEAVALDADGWRAFVDAFGDWNRRVREGRAAGCPHEGRGFYKLTGRDGRLLAAEWCPACRRNVRGDGVWVPHKELPGPAEALPPLPGRAGQPSLFAEAEQRGDA